MVISESLLCKVLKVAFEAGKAIMEVYQQPFAVELKSDNSPLTLADKTAHTIIAEGLSDTGLPLLSEEGAQEHYEIRKKWNEYWLIDPLDGTKEFVKKNGDFTVNIALISNQKPILGVVYAPVPGLIYWGSSEGSFRLNVKKTEDFVYTNINELLDIAERLPCISRSDGFLVLGSRSHMNTETELFINDLKNKYPDLSFVSKGSSLKFCTLAEGGADIYPRFSPTMEWDTAAGQAVAVFAGCFVDQSENGLPVTYNKQSLLNPFFIAGREKK